MPMHRTRVVDVDAFRWTGQKHYPEWLVANLSYPTCGNVRLVMTNADNSRAEAEEGDYFLRFPDGHVECRTPEEFESEFESIPADDRIPRVLESLRRAWELNPKWRLGQLLTNAITRLQGIKSLWTMTDTMAERELSKLEAYPARDDLRASE